MGSQRLDVLVGTQRRDHDRAQPLGNHLRFQQVTIDVVARDHFTLGRHAGLPRTQDDLQIRIPDFFPHVGDEPQTGIVGLHDDIEQHQCRVLMTLEKGFRFGSRVGAVQLDGDPGKRRIGQHQPGDLVNLALVVDQQHDPSVPCSGIGPHRCTIVRRAAMRCVRIHFRLLGAARSALARLDVGPATRGRRMTKRVPPAFRDVTSIDPLSRMVTML